MQNHSAATIPEAVFRMLDSLNVKEFDARLAAKTLSVFDSELSGEQNGSPLSWIAKRALPDWLSELSGEQNGSPLSWCAVLDNILSRGTPTLASPFVEDVLARRLGLTQKVESTIGNISFKLVEGLDETLLKQHIRRALYPVEPRLLPSITYPFHPETEDYEKKFAAEFLPRQLGDEYAFIFQLLEPQRSFKSIVSEGFIDQRCDFALELPSNGNDKLIFELDGDEHHQQPQRYHDEARDTEAAKNGWKTIGVTNQEVTRGFFDDRIVPDRLKRLRYNSLRKAYLNTFLKKAPIQIVQKSFEEPCWENEFARKVFQLVLTPIAVARIQKTFLQFIRAGVLSLDAPTWRIAIHERDVPCAWLAVEDFLQLLSNLLCLQGRKFTPQVEVRAYCSEEFEEAELGEPESYLSFPFQREVAGFHGEFTSTVAPFDADLFIDTAVLQRKGFTTIEHLLQNRVTPRAKTAVIRSVYSIQQERTIATAEPVWYEHVDSEGKRSALRYFLQFIFRKEDFREGQVDILKRALARQSVIGLLPTGAGKSLCYQLATLLQPGISLVVDPIKSLMNDQNDNLIDAGIDVTVFVNSTLTTEERIEKIRRFKLGYFQFAFISPERLLTKEFRDALTEMGSPESSKWFAYCVVDEAHCVSEWGHDFRTAYLRLGDNARKFCKTASGELPIIALTGTASFDVLSDVQRELKIDDEKAIIMPKSYEREELKFKIIKVEKPELPEEIEGKSPDNLSSKDLLKIKETVAAQKTEFLTQWLQNIHEQFEVGEFRDVNFFELNGEQTKSGLVFCPHVGWVFGVKEIAKNIQTAIPWVSDRIGIYAGKLEEDEETHNLQETQRKFKKNELALLAVTKAFGMGTLTKAKELFSLTGVLHL